MQITVEDKSTVKKILHVKISEDKVSGELDAAYKQLKKTAKIKGFRPGKAPRSVLERMYRKDVNADVSARLIEESLREAIQANDLALVGRPEIDPPALKDKEPYVFDVAVEVRPELADVDYKGLQLTKTLYQVSDKEIQSQIEMFRKNLAKLEPIEEKRPAQEGDFAIVDYTALEDGQPIEGEEKTENFTMKIGGGAIAEEFDEAVIGMKGEEEKQITISFPEDAFNQTFAGRTVDFSIKLKEIKEEVLPEVDDDLAKKLGNFQSLDVLKEKIIENVQQGYDKRIEQELNEQIFKELIGRQEFEVPDTMVAYELDSMIDEMERAFAYQNMSLEQLGQSREALSEKYRDSAVKQVKRHLILGKLIDQEKLDLTDEEMDQGYEEMARSVNQPVASIQQYYKENPDNLEFFKHTLLEKKAIGLIIDNSDIEEKEPEEAEAVEQE